jgi:hypothetical protein
MKTFKYTIISEVIIEAETREEANAEFSEEYSDNLNQYIISEKVTVSEG